MKRNIVVFGLICGTIITVFMICTVDMCYTNADFSGNIVAGYAAMLLAFSGIFVAIKNFRDKHNNGSITFGKAFRMGLYISLIASTMYVVGWLIYYYLFIPDFMDKYIPHVMKEAKTSGASQLELAEKAKEMEGFKEMYKNPGFVILFTYFEVLPIALAISLISALILKRKPKADIAN